MKLRDKLNESPKIDKFTSLMLKSGFLYSTERNLLKYNRFDNKDNREENIYHSNKEFWVILKEMRINDEYMVKYLSPYLAYDKEEDSNLYGWTDGNNTWDNYYNSVHDDDTMVIMFLPK